MRGLSTAALGQRRLVLVVTLLVAAFVLFFPARQLIQQRREMGALEQRLSALRAEEDRLRRDVARLSDPTEIEVLARERLALIRPGERAYFVEPPAARPVAGAEPPRERESGSLWTRGWGWVVGLFRGR